MACESALTLFKMPTTLSPTDVANAALSKVGAQAITSLLDRTSSSAIICNQNYGLAVAEVSRAGRWSCILNTAQLTAIVQTPVVPSGAGAITATPWAPNTAYLADTFISYGDYYYTVMFNLTSSANFFNDLTAGYYTQTDQQWGTSVPDAFSPVDGSMYQSGWPFAYALPADFQLLVALNDNTIATCWGGGGQQLSDYEIIGGNIYCNDSIAVIQYVQDQPDSTRFDSLFVNALTFKLASMISTPLRHDGGNMEAAMLSEYKRALREARQRNGGERQSRRFNPIGTSIMNQARYKGLLG